MLKNGNYIAVQKIRNHHVQIIFIFLVFIFFYFFLFSHNYRTKTAPTFAHSSKNLFFHIQFTIKILSKSITSNSVIFSILVQFFSSVQFLDIDLKKFFKKSKYGIFFGRPSTYYVEKKTKIMRVTARSIWAGMPHIDVKTRKSIHGNKTYYCRKYNLQRITSKHCSDYSQSLDRICPPGNKRST